MPVRTSTLWHVVVVGTVAGVSASVYATRKLPAPVVAATADATACRACGVFTGCELFLPCVPCLSFTIRVFRRAESCDWPRSANGTATPPAISAIAAATPTTRCVRTCVRRGTLTSSSATTTASVGTGCAGVARAPFTS